MALNDIRRVRDCVTFSSRSHAPTSTDRELKTIRKTLKLSHDVLRHTFFSAHVMAFGSFAETAIESGNSEQIIRTHYFNAIAKIQAKAFWRIEPE